MQDEYYQPSEKVNWLELPTSYALGMKHRESYRWWKPILAFALAMVLFFVFTLILCIPFVVSSLPMLSDLGILDDPTLSDTSLYDSAIADTSDPANPLSFALGLLCIVIMIPAFGIAAKALGLGGLRGLSSIEGRLRWDRIRAFAPWTVLVMVVLTAVTTGIDIALGDIDLSTLRFLPVSIIVVLICAPLQSAAEEYAFRGFCLQTFSSWIPAIVIPVILQALIFGSLHSQYNLLGMFSVAAMGLFAGYITCKTGGIEGGICIHATNNTIGMILTCFLASTEAGYDITLAACASDLVLQIAFCAIVLWVAKRKGFLLKKIAVASGAPVAK